MTYESDQERSLSRWTMTDVVEVYLSCSPSDYDEDADLSTDAEDLTDTDFAGSVHHLRHQTTSPTWVTQGRGNGGSKGNGSGSDEDDEGSERLDNNEVCCLL